MNRNIFEVCNKLPENRALLRTAQNVGVLKTIVRSLRSDETKHIHRFLL